MTTIVIKGDLTPDEIRRISALMQDIESMRPDELFQMYVNAPEMEGEADVIAAAMTPPPLPGYQRTEKRWERSEIEHHYRIGWDLDPEDKDVKSGIIPAHHTMTFDGADGQRRAREHLETLRMAEKENMLVRGSIVVEHRKSDIVRGEWEVVDDVD